MKRLSILVAIVVAIASLMLVAPTIAQEDVVEDAVTVSTTALINAENLVGEISPMTYDIVAHTLTVGFSIMLAALFYFVLTIRSVAPRFRVSSVLSVVVMVSAFLILFYQAQAWQNSFAFNSGLGTYQLAAGADAFSNGFRYLNWLIDVPMLLFQILFIVDITQNRRTSLRNQFWFSGIGMIVTGYIGQFYEAQAANFTSPFYIWGLLSTLFFVHVLYLTYRVIQEGKEGMQENAARVFGMIWPLFLVSWMLYPGGYLMPVLLNTEGLFGAGTITEAGIVGRALTYTIADVASKVVYGVILTQVAQIRSENMGYDPESGRIAAVTAPATGD
ncbi:MAG: bacteriorhodopsin [Anaerolineae bacterium]